MPSVLHVCPLWQPVAADAHGGVETFVAALVEAQQALGWECVVVASADSDPGAPVIAAAPAGVGALYEAGVASEYAPYEQQALFAALGAAAGFDIVHSHLGPVGYVLSGVPGLRARVVHTVHGPVGPDLVRLAEAQPRLRLATAGKRDAGRLPPGCGRWISHGVALPRFALDVPAGEHLLFLGRVEPAKGPDLAIAAARELGRPLVLAGPINDRAFHDARVAPWLGDGMRHVGVVGQAAKARLLAGAACLLVPSRAEEAFGLVAAEAMAAGTPVAALARGALGEVVEPGLTGALAEREGELAGAVASALGLDRGRVRRRAAERFDIARTAERYLAWYAELLCDREAAAPAAAGSGGRLRRPSA